MSEISTEQSFVSNIKTKVSSNIKEWYGTNYLLFTPGRLLTSMTIMFYAAVFSFFYNNEYIDTTQGISSNINFDLLEEYLIGLKVASILIVAYFLTFQWSNIHRNGDYGYWISLGVKREKFFFTTALFFISILFINAILSFTILRTIGGLKFALVDDANILLVILSTLVLMIGVAWVIGEVITKPELSSGVYLIFWAVNFQLYRNEDNLISDVLFAESHIGESSWLIHVLTPLVIGLGLIYFGFYLNKRREIAI